MNDPKLSKTTNQDRRHFLKSSAAVGAAAAIGGLSAFDARAAGKVGAVMPGVFMPKAGRPIVEKTAGVKLENIPYVSPTDTLAKIMAPGGTSRYDLMISVTEFVRGPIMGAKAGDERVMALDMGKIPNASKIMPLFKNDVVMRNGKTYMVPLVWGYDSVIYNKKFLNENDPNTQAWSVLFDDKHAGKVALRDEPHQSVMVAALAMGHKDPVSMDGKDLKEVEKFLISKKKNFRTLWSKFGEALNLISSGEVYAMYGWIAMRSRLQKQGHDVTNNWPKEGLLIWNQSGFIPKQAPNADGAHAVINAMLDSQFGKVLTEVTNYPSTSAEVANFFDKAEQKKLGLDIRERGVALYPLKWPKRMDLWIETWGRFKAA
ncbi:MAG: extracellular solute-binding protein [Alphaproteobacteria bacterium]|nr:extracellular solute-binding protein [Alphaproteobacteria bacterium]